MSDLASLIAQLSGNTAPPASDPAMAAVRAARASIDALVLKLGQSIDAKVVGQLAAGLTQLSAGNETLVLKLATPLPTGTAVTIKVAPTPQGAPAITVSVPATPPQSAPPLPLPAPATPPLVQPQAPPATAIRPQPPGPPPTSPPAVPQGSPPAQPQASPLPPQPAPPQAAQLPTTPAATQPAPLATTPLPASTATVAPTPAPAPAPLPTAAPAAQPVVVASPTLPPAIPSPPASPPVVPTVPVKTAPTPAAPPTQPLPAPGQPAQQLSLPVTPQQASAPITPAIVTPTSTTPLPNSAPLPVPAPPTMVAAPAQPIATTVGTSIPPRPPLPAHPSPYPAPPTAPTAATAQQLPLPVSRPPAAPLNLADPAQAAARQNSAAPLLANLAAVVAAPVPALPRPVLEAALKVLAGRIDLNRSAPDGKALEAAVLKAGVLLTPATQPAPTDSKSTLLALRAGLLALLGGDTSAPAAPAERPAPPLKGEPPRAPAPQAALPAATADTTETARTLLGHTDAALSRLKLLQSASQPAPDLRIDAPPPRNELRVEIPLLLGTQTGILQLSVERDGKQKRAPEKQRGWRMRFAMNFSQTGEVGADIAMLGRSASIAIWAADPDIADALDQMLPEISPAIQQHGLELASLRVRRGAPRPTQPAPGRLLDSAR